MTTYSHCMECAGGNAFSIWTAGTERDTEAPFLSGGWNYQWQQMPGGQDVGGGILPGGKDPQEKKKKSDGQRGSGSGFYFSQRGSAGIPARVELRVKHYQRFRLVCIGIARRFSCRIFPLHAGRTDNNRICRPRRSINQSNSHRTVTKPAACP